MLFYPLNFRDGMVPVVMGAPRKDYERLIPPNSFIHVDDFKNPEHLAEYLKLVGNNEKLYSKYLEWKKHYVMLSSNDWHCRLCALLHAGAPPMWYDDINKWYTGPGVCLDPSDANPYASWKIDEEINGSLSIASTKNSYKFH